MMHPDFLEEMDYQANAHSDYLSEAFGPTARDADLFCESDYYWDSERECDVRDIPTVCDQRYDRDVVRCVEHFLWAVSTLSPDYFPF